MLHELVKSVNFKFLPLLWSIFHNIYGTFFYCIDEYWSTVLFFFFFLCCFFNVYFFGVEKHFTCLENKSSLFAPRMCCVNLRWNAIMSTCIFWIVVCTFFSWCKLLTVFLFISVSNVKLNCLLVGVQVSLSLFFLVLFLVRDLVFFLFLFAASMSKCPGGWMNAWVDVYGCTKGKSHLIWAFSL